MRAGMAEDKGLRYLFVYVDRAEDAWLPDVYIGAIVNRTLSIRQIAPPQRQ